MTGKDRVKIAERIIESIYHNTDVTDSFLLKSDPLHSKAAKEWVLKLKPDANDTLQIAALGHDIDRAFAKRSIKQSDYPEDQYAEYKHAHSINSANILAKHLETAGLDKKLIERVKYLVENHEVGGDTDAEVLKEADSLTFFSVNIPFYLEARGAKKTKKKILFMLTRLSDRAKSLVRQLKFEDSRVAKLFTEALEEI